MEKPIWPTLLGIWLLISILFIGTHSDFYFRKAHYEGGDFAANALQIREAKAFHEIYGNYSRFGFRHPGPAFFYAYALGETILFDVLKIVPAPYNAHALTGLLIQAFFFAWALWIIAKRVRRPMLLPFLLLFAALHFGMVNANLPDSAFESIWPPYVLLFPFLCFLIATASVASGEVTDLIPLVLSGCVLVHGHVAQPLFVVPLFVLSYVAVCFGRPVDNRRGILGPFRAAPYTHLCAVAIVLVFLLPMGIDLYRSNESNLRLILRQFSLHANEHKSVAQSLLYFLGFVCYLGKPETYCDHLALSSLRFLADRWYFLTMWIVIALLACISFKRIRGDERHFVRWLLICSGVAALLTVVWGKLQHAEMFAFNAHFNFALLFVPLVVLAIAFSSGGTSFRTSQTSEKYLRTFLYAASIPLGLLAATNWNWSWSLPTAPHGTEAMVQQIRQTAIDDRQSSKVKFLSFAHDDWEWAAGVALALDRSGYGFAIPPDWTFIFGPRHRADLVTSLSRGEVAFWKIQSPALGWDNWISNAVPPIDPADGEITFSGPGANASAFAISGWQPSGDALTIRKGQTALLYFAALPASSDVHVKVVPATLSPNTTQRLLIFFNNGPSESFEVAEKASLSFRVPKEVWNRRAYATLAFTFEDSSKTNLRGGEFIRIDFHPVDTTSSSNSTVPH